MPKTDRTLCEDHALALELLPAAPLSLLESCARVDLARIRTGDEDGADRAALSCENGIWVLIFAAQGDEVMLAAYPCDGAGRVANWKTRYEISGPNWVSAVEKLRFALVNELIETWNI